MNKFLILGSGELGHEIITSLREHPQFSTSTHDITLTIRPSTLSNLSPSRQSQIDTYKSQSVTILPLDIETSPLESLTQTFSDYTTIIHAGGMTLQSGTQLKVTQAVLSTTPKVSLYIPWQFGIDYDLIGPDAGNGLFAEQHRIRQLLRSQTDVHWLIVSNGIFMSFLFEEFWGVFHLPKPKPNSSPSPSPSNNPPKITALGSWTDTLAITTAHDIGKCTAELIFVDTHLRDKPVFIAGDSLSYSDLADIVSRVFTPGGGGNDDDSKQGRVIRDQWTTDHLIQTSRQDPHNKLLQYRVVFSSGVGLDWNEADVYNKQKRIKMVGVEEWLREREFLCRIE